MDERTENRTPISHLAKAGATIKHVRQKQSHLPLMVGGINY